MATVTAIDYRRTDLRNYKTDQPFWMTSAEVDEADAEDLAAILFSFPGDQDFLIHKVILEITEQAAGGTEALTIGLANIATDDITTGGDVTTDDVDYYFAETEADSDGAVGLRHPVVTQPFGAAWLANTGAPLSIIGADATVQCVVGYQSSDSALTAGKYKVHMLVSKLPA